MNTENKKDSIETIERLNKLQEFLDTIETIDNYAIPIKPSNVCLMSIMQLLQMHGQYENMQTVRKAVQLFLYHNHKITDNRIISTIQNKAVAVVFDDILRHQLITELSLEYELNFV